MSSKMKFIIVAIAAVILAACVYQPTQKMTGANRVIYCANKDYNPATAPTDIKMCRLGLSR